MTYRWGWGNIRTEPAPAGWRCSCGWKPSTKDRNVLVSLTGELRCGDCARRWHLDVDLGRALLTVSSGGTSGGDAGEAVRAPEAAHPTQGTLELW
jgi:hypothetical protein